MFIPNPAPVFDAYREASDRDLLPTSLGTKELRELGAGTLARSVFVARGTSAAFLSKLKEVVEQLTAGNIGEADARLILLEALKALGYTPEGGFPDAPGAVPPAMKGTLQDLSSFRRLDLIVRTQIDLMRGAGQQFRGQEPARLQAAPAWELFRIEQKDAPRKWSSQEDGSDARHSGKIDERSRWTIAGGKLSGRRMIALKGDPVWGELGSSSNFDDALDVDHPPFAFHSGMWWREVSRAECIALGVTGPDGESIEEFHQGIERPRIIAGQLPLPKPRLSTKGVDPDLLEQFRRETEATPSKTGGSSYDYSDLLEEGLANASTEYLKKNPGYKGGNL